MRLERLAYSFFGNNLIIGPHIRKQLKFLKGIVPSTFQERLMDDLGCGDGKVTLRLKEIFLPRRVRGFDIDPGLVRRARKKGITADIQNLEENIPQGELAVLWGVIHHLKDKNCCLDRLKQNYAMVFIREPVRSSAGRWLELGHPLTMGEIEGLVAKHFPDAQVFYYGNSVFIFYVSPEPNVRSLPVD